MLHCQLESKINPIDQPPKQAPAKQQCRTILQIDKLQIRVEMTTQLQKQVSNTNLIGSYNNNKYQQQSTTINIIIIYITTYNERRQFVQQSICETSRCIDAISPTHRQTTTTTKI
jgi:hypothetical protein